VTVRGFIARCPLVERGDLGVDEDVDSPLDATEPQDAA
jgi:hypothetical protein